MTQNKKIWTPLVIFLVFFSAFLSNGFVKVFLVISRYTDPYNTFRWIAGYLLYVLDMFSGLIAAFSFVSLLHIFLEKAKDVVIVKVGNESGPRYFGMRKSVFYLMVIFFALFMLLPIALGVVQGFKSIFS